jgi:protoheme IX farnesyltransferase
VRDSLGIGDLAAVALFAIVFFWQVPHFLAIAWIYRDDYARAGLPMLPVVDRAGNRTSRAMILNCLALLAVSLAAPLLGVGGLVSLIGAMLLGLGFLRTTIGFARTRSIAQARQVLRASLVYLPCILALLVVDHLFIAKPLLFWR